MSAHALIAAARAEGLTIGIEGDNLVIETDRDPPAALLAQLREHKAELLAVLSADDPEERAAKHPRLVDPVDNSDNRSAAPSAIVTNVSRYCH